MKILGLMFNLIMAVLSLTFAVRFIYLSVTGVPLDSTQVWIGIAVAWGVCSQIFVERFNKIVNEMR